VGRAGPILARAKHLLQDAISRGNAKKITLKKMEIDNELAEAIAQHLPSFSVGALETLELSHNRIGDAGLIAVLDALTDCAPMLRTLWLDDNVIGLRGAERLADFLKVNSSLAILGLGSNNFGDAGVVCIAEALASSGTLRELKLKNNALGDAAAESLSMTLQANRALKRLHLECNAISEVGQTALREAAQPHFRLELNDQAGWRTPAAPDVLITAEPQTPSQKLLHLPNVEEEASAIMGAFGARAERVSRTSVEELKGLLRGKRIWFFQGHGDAMLKGEAVLAFEKDGELETVSIQTLVDTVRPYGKSGQLKLVVLTGCCTLPLATALHERAGVADVVCWSTALHDKAGAIFGEAFANTTALQGARLQPSAALAAARAAVETPTEAGQLDNVNLNAQVQIFELDVDPRDASRVDPNSGRIFTSGRLAAGIPEHVTSSRGDVVP
jgi:hypothetical protein